MEVKDWILVLGPIVGVVIGGLIASIGKLIEIRSNRRYALLDMKLARLESLHQQITEFLLSLSRVPSEAMALCSVNVTEHERRTCISPIVEHYSTHSAKIGSLILTHAPKVSDKISVMMKRSTEVGNTLFEFMNLHLQPRVLPEDREAHLVNIKRSTIALADSLGELQTLIGTEIKERLEGH